MDTLFLAFRVPESIASALHPLYERYSGVLQEQVPPKKLHLTLWWLGEASPPPSLIEKLAQPLPQSFVSTVRLTHVGRGRTRHQLWAFGEATGPIMAIREQLFDRLHSIGWQVPRQGPRLSYTPHITVGTLYDQVSHIGVADYPFVTSYTVSEAVLYKSSPSLTPGQKNEYIPLATIPLT